MRGTEWQLIVEFLVVSNDGRHGSCPHLLDVRSHQRRNSFSFAEFDLTKTMRMGNELALVGPTWQDQNLMQQSIRNRLFPATRDEWCGGEQLLNGLV